MNPKTQAFIAVVTVLIVASTFLNSALARPIGPYDIAKFVNDPYPRGTSTVTVYYCHDSPGWMFMELYNPNNQLAYVWAALEGDIEQETCTVSDIDGTWTLKYYMPGHTSCYDYALFHTPAFNVKEGLQDPRPLQANLAGDWARHPDDSAISRKALAITVGSAVTISSYEAASRIYSHVLAYFYHDESYLTFRRDLDLLNDLNSLGKYHGVCRSDAVLLTAYARALGIPARIIHLLARATGHGQTPPGGPDDNHYFAELYVRNGGSYQWIPVDSDPAYSWFGINEANAEISRIWSSSSIFEWEIYISIVTKIPTENIMNPSSDEIAYDGANTYRNDL